MSRAILLIVALGLLAATEAISEEAQFAQFTTQYGKVYSGQAERNERLAIFKTNLRKIEQQNKQNPEATFGINKFADLSAEEFKATYLGVKGAVRNPEHPVAVVSKEAVAAMPTSFDWVPKGAVTPVKNQGQCGSCWSFSAAQNIEGQWFLSNHSLPVLSEQEFVDCDHQCSMDQGQKVCDQGCNGGLMSNAFMFAIAEGGVDSEASYPYEGVDGTCRFKQADVAAKISNWTMLPEDEDQIAAYLAEHGPVAIAADAEPWQFYTGGVFRLPCGTSLDHGILLTGYGNQSVIGDRDIKYWDIKNSWGADWGLNGYIKLERGVGKCGVNLFACSSIV